MKRIILITAAALLGLSVSAQNGLRIGLNAGIPVGDNGDFASFIANIELDYDWEVSEIINVGVSAGATVYSGKEMFNDFKYAPILASVDVSVTDDLSLGGDIGYGISLESGFDGALVYRFQLRYNISEKFDVSGRFNAFSSDIGTLSDATVGVGYRF